MRCMAPGPPPAVHAVHGAWCRWGPRRPAPTLGCCERGARPFPPSLLSGSSRQCSCAAQSDSPASSEHRAPPPGLFLSLGRAFMAVASLRQSRVEPQPGTPNLQAATSDAAQMFSSSLRGCQQRLHQTHLTSGLRQPPRAGTNPVPLCQTPALPPHPVPQSPGHPRARMGMKAEAEVGAGAAGGPGTLQTLYSPAAPLPPRASPGDGGAKHQARGARSWLPAASRPWPAVLALFEHPHLHPRRTPTASRTAEKIMPSSCKGAKSGGGGAFSIAHPAPGPPARPPNHHPPTWARSWGGVLWSRRRATFSGERNRCSTLMVAVRLCTYPRHGSVRGRGSAVPQFPQGALAQLPPPGVG